MKWLNDIADELERRHPEGEILIETGASPSGTFHIGHLREWVTGDAILLELRRRGRQARLIHFIDDLDALRKIPVNIPAEYEKYLGMPLCDVPAPDGSDRSYGAYFAQNVIDACRELGIDMEFIESHKKYRSGFFVPAIERSLERLDEVRDALIRVSGRQLDEDWSPIQVLEDGRLRKRAFVSIDTDNKTLVYIGADGEHKTVAYDGGLVKLDWRLDFPAHWWLQGVACEPSGRDHSTKGGSVDTGNEICRIVYEHEPPLPVPYDFINMVGDTKKMSASKGTGLDAEQGSKILPPEVIRFFIMRAAPGKRLYFDPIDGVVQLMDEFAALAAKPDKTESEQQLLHICTRGIDRKTVSRVPFSLLVSAYQAALKDADRTVEIIGRTEYAQVAAADAEIVKEELRFIDNWLQLHAPEDVKFELTETVDASTLSDTQKQYLSLLADKVEAAPADADGSWFHDAIYGLKDELGMAPKELFSSLYQVIVGKPNGPRAGWFLSILPRDWLVGRLRLEGVEQGGPAAAETAQAADVTVRLTDACGFTIDRAIFDTFPQASVGYLVAEIGETPIPAADDPITMAVQSLTERGVTAENLTQQPEIAVWREAFRTFGVKPSDYLSSAEALAKRSLKGNAPHVSPLVDCYNAVSIRHLIPMGAMDLDHVQGDVRLRYGRDGETADLLGMEKPVPVQPSHVVYADDAQVITWLWNHRDAKVTAVSGESRRMVFFADSLLGRLHAELAIDELAGKLRAMGVTIHASGVCAADL